jgi:hypothetical protein
LSGAGVDCQFRSQSIDKGICDLSSSKMKTPGVELDALLRLKAIGSDLDFPPTEPIRPGAAHGKCRYGPFSPPFQITARCFPGKARYKPLGPHLEYLDGWFKP